MAKGSGKLEHLAGQLRELSEELAREQTSELAASQAKRIRKTLAGAYGKLRKTLEDLDPIKHADFIFDPSNPAIAGRIAGITMIAQPRKPLASVDRFYGSGVYAIYYTGGFKPYEAISGREHPIYVGKADPADPGGKTAVEQGDRLSARLSEHRKNIVKAAATLKVHDFDYRALVVQTGWQGSAENYLINLFRPIWNSETGICYGFGKHGDAPETRANLRSPWDTLHHGRDWAHRNPEMKDARTAERIAEDVAQHLAIHPPLETIDQILRRFLDEMRTSS